MSWSPILVALILLAPPDPTADTIPDGLLCLGDAYPDSIRYVTPEVVLMDGTVIPWDDGQQKDPATLLANPDLEDQMAVPYPAGAGWEGPPPRGHDPGRVRHDVFFRKVYGASRDAVAARLVTIPWMPKTTRRTVRVTTTGGVHEKVRAISEELDRLPERLKKFVMEPSSFHWRTIKGTDRLSAHSFGIAIDIGVKYSNYWRWDLRQAKNGVPAWRNRIPMEIVEVFERHGFIWGGKWTHYDTMHFEYRPELLHPRCHASERKKRLEADPDH